MKFCNFSSGRDFDLRAGLVVGDDVYGLQAVLNVRPRCFEGMVQGLVPRVDHTTIEWLWRLRDCFRDLTTEELSGMPAYRLDEVRLGPPVSPVISVRDFYAFEQHVETARAQRGLEMIPEWYEIPVFYFSNPRTVIGHDEPVVAPAHGEELDFELEVAAVIGLAGRDIPAERADEHILGYTIFNDWSLRDVQRREMKVGLGPAKGKDFASSLGPFLVSTEEIEDRRADKAFDLEMVARINGTEVSRGNLRTLTHSFGEMVARASQGVMLYPGDVIGSGTVGTGCILERTPEAVGGWLEPGDVVELEVERLGVLRNRIVIDEH